MTLENKVAIVTGAGRGAGRSIALALAGEGMSVALVARSRDELEAVSAEIEMSGGSGTPICADVGNEEQVEHAVALAAETYGRIDVLVNNAGIGVYGAIESFSLSDWNRTIATNLTGPFLMSRAALPHLRRERGAIIAIGSGAGLQGYAQRTAYSASKFGIRGLMQSLALEAPDVKVCTIHAGNMLTDFSTRTRAERIVSGQRFLEPEDLADAIVFLLKQSRHAWTQEMRLWPFGE